MRAAGNLQIHAIILLFLTTFTAAWPLWPRWLPDLDSLVARQNSGSGSSSVNGTTQQTTAPAEGGKSSETGGTTSTSKQTGTAQKTTSTVTNKATTTSKKSTSTTFDARFPVGGVSMISPAIASGAQYYKIGDLVTFAWNYTSLLATPTAVNILATCTANNALYTLAANQTVTGNATGVVTWDTGAYQSTALSAPLLTETYTLIIYDAASSISATPKAGFLATFEQYTFGMYVPQAYTPLGEYICVTCSGALSDMERRALGMVFGISIITVLSFTWFVGGTGIIW